MSASDFLFDPTLADITDEAFERVGIDPATITARHIGSARRSMNLMLADWSTHGIRDWALDQQEQAINPGMTSFELPPGGYDIVNAVLRRDGLDTEMYPISRGDYQAIPDKDICGLPDRYWVDRSPVMPTVYIWQAGENGTDVMRYWLFKQYRDVGGATSGLNMPHFFYEAFAAGLAARLAEKYMPGRLAEKVQLSERAFDLALMESGSRAPLTIRARYR